MISQCCRIRFQVDGRVWAAITVNKRGGPLVSIANPRDDCGAWGYLGWQHFLTQHGVDQGGFAAAGWSHECNELALFYLQVNALEDCILALTDAISFLDVF